MLVQVLMLLLLVLLACRLCLLEENIPKVRSRSYRKQIEQLNESVQDLMDKYKYLKTRFDKMEKKLRQTDCPVGYLRHKNYCMWFIMGKQNRRNWLDAKDECLRTGAQLVTVNNRKKEKFIRAFLAENYRREPVKLYTGLIATDSQADTPFNVQGFNPASDKGRSMDSVRWTATKEAVKVTSHMPAHPVVKWSPKIIGEQDGPTNTLYSALSCVIITWDPRGNKKSLTWRYHLCTNDPLNYICEIKIANRKRRRQQKKRTKRYVYESIDRTSQAEDSADDFSVEEFEVE